MIENQPQSPGQYPEFIALYKNFLEKLLSVNSDELRFSIQLMMCWIDDYQTWLKTLDSMKVFQAQMQYGHAYLALCETLNNLTPSSSNSDGKTTDIQDRRFQGEVWHESRYFRFFVNHYLLICEHVHKFVKENKTPDKHLNQKIKFLTQQWLDALSPSNFYFSNPTVLNQTLMSKGENFILGFENFMKDWITGNGKWQIKMTQMDAFVLGENIAATKGKVIYRNRMMELIQYTPTTDQVHEIPLLMIPPWINKYYILDLREKNSLVKWALDQGFSVYMVSWINPDASYKATSFFDYLDQGILSAIGVIQKVANVEKINALGFCIGGTLLAATMAYLAAQKLDLIQSCTYLTTLIDFTDVGDVGVFIDEKQVAAIHEYMERQGVLSGNHLMMSFNLLRANDLFWSFFINNYLCGKEPFPFDLLFWNCDNTNLPCEMHRFYLENMYLKNLLIQPNGLSLNGVPLDIRNIHAPSYFLSAKQDHIAPWKTTYTGAIQLGGPVTFVLGGSGHIAGVINPPANEKYGYACLEKGKSYTKNSSEWLQQATQHAGSWWTHWAEWLKPKSGPKVKAKTTSSQEYLPIGEAPGRYVRNKSASN